MQQVDNLRQQNFNYFYLKRRDLKEMVEVVILVLVMLQIIIIVSIHCHVDAARVIKLEHKYIRGGRRM